MTKNHQDMWQGIKRYLNILKARCPYSTSLAQQTLATLLHKTQAGRYIFCSALRTGKSTAYFAIKTILTYSK
jgi:hypothetical protein